LLEAHASATIKMPTPVLTRLLHEAVQHQAPKRSGRFRPKLRYAHQGGMNPPLVVIHGNAGARDRCLQALPGRALARAFQAGGHAAAH
jgi:predicted GTPase